MSRTLLATLTLIAAAACGGGDRRDVATADSLSRDLQLAPVDTTAELNDQPAAAVDTAPTPAPEPTPTPPPPPAPKPKPKPKPKPAPKPAPSPSAVAPAESTAPTAPAPPAPPVERALAVGSTIAVTTDAEIRSNKQKVGDELTATVASDAKDTEGRVVIPAGSKVTLKVTAIKESENKGDSTGTLTVQPVSISINGSSRPLAATIAKVNSKLEGRGTNVGDVAKVGVGTAAGAIVGRVIGGGGTGAIIGGVIGGAIGTQRAVETKDRDVVVPQGTSVTLKLDEKFVAQS